MHLYIHVPFCARRCSYCDFAIAVRREVPSAAFTESLLREWRRWLGDQSTGGVRALETVYFGGGTPSRLSPPHLAGLIEGVTADRPISPGAEVTLEANPEDVTPESARAWHAAGITRVSLGVQTFDEGVLKWMHRSHLADDVGRAVAELRAAGIRSLSLDLIYGLPTQLGRDWSRDLARALALEPDHLSLYALTIEPSTPLARWIDRGAAAAPVDERQAGEFLEAHLRLTSAGFHHYEVSNFGRLGHESRHNRAYWERRPYLGLGPSAHSAMLYLGLRTSAGVPAHRVGRAKREEWEAKGWAQLRGENIVLLPEGWLRLDALLAQRGE
jgi:oxygen-independent coproporphyrinogen-3 oxidase